MSECCRRLVACCGGLVWVVPYSVGGHIVGVLVYCGASKAAREDADRLQHKPEGGRGLLWLAVML